MKNRIYSFVMIAALLAACALPAVAQNQPGLYSFFSGVTLPNGSSNQYTNSTSTNTWGAATTSTNFVINVSSCDYVGLTITGAGKDTTTNLVSLFKSFDNGSTFEPTASFRYGQSYTAGAVTTTNTSLDVHGVTHLALVMGPVGDANITNAAVRLNLKAPAMYPIPPINFGRVTTPIIVPGWSTNWGQ